MKYRFYEPGCDSCHFLVTVGTEPFETRYCTNYPRNRRKRFNKSAPKFRAPKWCPRRLNPPALRIYGFASENSRQMELEFSAVPRDPMPQYMHPMPFHYKLRLERRYFITARQFYESASKSDSLLELAQEVGLEYGEVIEIDNGLRSHCFFYYGGGRIIPSVQFDTSKVQK